MQYDVIMCVTWEDIYPVVASLCHDHTDTCTDEFFDTNMCMCVWTKARYMYCITTIFDKGKIWQIRRLDLPIGKSLNWQNGWIM